jgi:hypothetical protein
VKRLTAAQEQYLLRFHFGERGGSPVVARALFALGMLGADPRGNAVLTDKGKAYLDLQHVKITKPLVS